jgi:SpoVK/Ycf46/Vps4 family AAA+-type ATPase
MDVADMVTVIREMPDPHYAHLWDCIIVEQAVKDRLLRSALLGLRLRAELPFETTALHGLILLHGPPGTGKTTLGRGLAHQLAPFTKRRKTRLIEINPHGLMSAEHGQSQRKVTELLTQYIPQLADDLLPTVVLLDEVESMAVARSEASLAANPADVHRATDAVLAALDSSAAGLAHLVFVATSNFTGALDIAFHSRVDAAIHMPAPDTEAAVAILKHTLEGMSTRFPALARLAKSSALRKVAQRLAGNDGRRIRKTVTEGMLGRLEASIDPGQLTVDDLLEAATRVSTNGRPEVRKRGERKWNELGASRQPPFGVRPRRGR